MRPRTWMGLLLLLGSSHAAEAPIGYYRFPAIQGDTIVFAAEGDLWRVGAAGGTATRLTTHPADESCPAISPDGSLLAYSASYEGPTEVYTMPIEGGPPVRRTFEGESAIVVGWTPDGQVLYSTRHASTLPSRQLVRLDLASGLRTILPLAEASDGAYGADGRTLFFTRYAFQGSHTKLYKGGTAQNLWKLAPGAPEAVPLTADYPGTSRRPMVWENRVYFVSDRDGSMNLWSMDPNGADLRQHTSHRGWDVASPSLGSGRIVYQLGADLRLYDIAAARDTALDVRLASDFDQEREAWIRKPMDFLTSAALSPKGDRVALTARGQVFVAPAHQGRLVEVTRKPGVRYRQTVFFPDGKSLLTLSDESGEVELWRLPANGAGAPQQLTSNAKVLRWEAVPSPDGRFVAHHDKDHQLWLDDLEHKKQTRIAVSSVDDFIDLRWSPDSRWLAYCAPAENMFFQIWLYEAATGKSTPVTTDRFDSYSPAWSADGQWLYFLSDRYLRTLVDAPWGPRQPDPFTATPTQIYALALHKEFRSPFQAYDELHPKSLEPNEPNEPNEPAKGSASAASAAAQGTSGKAPDAKKPDAKGQAAEKKPVEPEPKPVTIDLAGIESRLVPVPASPGRYRALTTDDKRLYWIAVDATFDHKLSLQVLAIDPEKPEQKTLLEDIQEYALSADRQKLLVRKADQLYIFDAGDKAPEKLDDSKVDLGRWIFPIQPREQWRQMFVEAWRLERDYFYSREMNHVDWKAMLEKYRPLADRVTCRGELSDLLGQMIGELGALHMFVSPGDVRHGEDPIEIGSLGAVFERDEAAGGWRITRIYRTDPDFPADLAPLLQPGVQASEGEVLEAINGVSTLSVPDPAILLRNQAGRQVLLRLRSGPNGASREAVAVPIGKEQDMSLRYSDWELGRRKQVEQLGGGQIGYVHLRAMGGENWAEWARGFYPVFNRQGLILDVRHNDGGNIDSWLLGKLMRKAWFYWQPRVGQPYWNMQYAFRGHMVVLVDAWTASDGEAFAEGFRRLGLGKVIGTRTWGGEIWLTSSNLLVDKGIASAAENGVYGPEGQWLIEGHGVDPDIVVDNLPRATFDGHDAQLEAAVRHLQERIREQPLIVPAAPAYPDKSFRPPEPNAP
jgi:tricorn protease